MKLLTRADVLHRPIKVDISKPPNWPEIIRVFPHVEHRTGILFCYGDTIHNPSNIVIPPHLLAHEGVHSIQQETIGVEWWWYRYLDYPQFRLEQETEAHRVEIEDYNSSHNRHLRRIYEKACAERLAGPLYGSLVKTRKALALLRENSNAAE